ncbi:hypothetical protein Q4Q35_14625 [Flavivirga aquimarina]|uniref:SIR2-like domain-containing protein n=1 Tax=Flavivirga aquimarina TaxID=2027862 RepID=A0ABT8WD21_9FLAO|nr:hypothetical protein [Flavivirga aquimarina]MDO5971039.1 hypothetical protein [Flavivirga aquimarina]
MKGKNITFVVGAGAVENAWNPVIRAINKTDNIKTNGDGANFLFARYIYLLKFYSTVAKARKHPEMFEIMKSNIRVLKNNIAYELKKAQNSGEIKPRENFKEVIDKFVVSKVDRSYVVNTNWDNVIDLEINKLYRSNNPNTNFKIESFHIHGSIESPDELYLPSEITQEIYRTKEDEMKLGSNHASLMSILEKGNRTILYGISLDPLDAELNQTLGAGCLSPNIEEIIIINPSHELVANRVKLLLDKRYPAKITAYNPNDLRKKIEYN